VKKNPEKWSTAQDAVRYAAWDTARGKAWDAAWDAAWGAAWDAAGGAARDAILALLAWDDCAYMLGLPEDALKVLRAAGNEQAILLSVAANILRETS